MNLILGLILIGGAVLFFVCYFHVITCYRDYYEVRRLTAPSIIPESSNDIPTANGVLVNQMNENLPIITID